MRNNIRYNNFSQNTISELKGFQIKNKLGEGSFANVFKVVRIEDNQEYALKKIKLNQMQHKDIQNAMNEVRFLASIKSPFIVSYKESIYSESAKELYIIMEFMGGGDVLGLIKKYKNRNKYIEEDRIWKYLAQLALGLKTMHDLNILHRDIKCQNIFLNSERDEVKIGDLNVSKVANNGLLYTQVGTPYYASPEIWKDKPYSSKSDIWSLGCVIYELCTLHPPFRGNNMNMLFQSVKNSNYTPISKYYSAELSQFIASCLRVNPSKRPSSTQILQLEKVKEQIIKMTQLPKRKISIRNDLPTSNKENIPTYKKSVSTNCLINTIKVNKNLKNIGQKLPQQKYYSDEQLSMDISIGLIEDQSMDNSNSKNKIPSSLPVINQRDLSSEKQYPVKVVKVVTSKNDQGKKVQLPLIEKSNSILNELDNNSAKIDKKPNSMLSQNKQIEKEIQGLQNQLEIKKQIIDKQMKNIQDTKFQQNKQIQQYQKVQDALTRITQTRNRNPSHQPQKINKNDQIQDIYQVRHKSNSNKNLKPVKISPNKNNNDLSDYSYVPNNQYMMNNHQYIQNSIPMSNSNQGQQLQTDRRSRYY